MWTLLAVTLLGAWVLRIIWKHDPGDTMGVVDWLAAVLCAGAVALLALGAWAFAGMDQAFPPFD